MTHAEDSLTDIGLDLWVLVHHLYAKHRTSPVAAFRELTLRTRVPFRGADARLATSPAALRGTAWHRTMAARWAALRTLLREEQHDCVQEAAAVVQSLYPSGCATETYADALQTCAAMLTRSIPAHRLEAFAAQRVAELRAEHRGVVGADELSRDLMERPLLDAMCPARWWERSHSDAEMDGVAAVAVRAVALGTSPPRLCFLYTRDGGDTRVRRVGLAGLLHASGPTAPLARRLARSHGAIVGEEQLRGYLLRLQRMMAAEKDAEQLHTEQEPERANAEYTANKESTSTSTSTSTSSTSASLMSGSVVRHAKEAQNRLAPNKADVGLLYRDPEAALTNVDLNDADDVTLREFKAKMEEGFQEKVVLPDDPRYIYDKRIEVRPTQKSDWDDSD